MAALEREVAAIEARVKNLTDRLGHMGFSRALSAALVAEETRLEEAKAKFAASQKSSRPNIVPHPKVIESYVTNLLTLPETDKPRARELLVRHMQPLVMTPAGADLPGDRRV